MAPLTNPRHEKFAQEIAKGKSQGEAYKVSGYDAEGHVAESAGNRLLKKVEVSERVAEILGRSAVRAEISVARFTTDLLRLAGKAEKLADDQSNSTGYAVAKACAMDAAKLNGLVIDRSERGNPGEFADIENMDAAQLREYVAKSTTQAPSPDDQDETRH